MATPPPELPTTLVGIWHRGYDAGLRKASADPPYPTISSSFVAYMCNIWSDGYVAGLEYREAHGIRLRPRQFPTADVFWERVDVGAPDDCWTWQGYVRPGERYAVIRLGVHEQTRKVHRIAYELANGDTPAGRHVHHICRNPLCCNPRHLAALTPEEHRLIPREFERKTHCANGHRFTPENTLTDRNGWRRCRRCARASDERVRRRKGMLPQGTPKTHCPHGHEYTPENTITHPSSGRRCRTCVKEYRAAWARADRLRNRSARAQSD